MIQASTPWLSFSIWLPILLGVIIAIWGAQSAQPGHALQVKRVSLGAAVLCFLVTLPLISGFDPSHSGIS